MKRYPPEDFFHGTQLMLAQAIYEGDLNAVSALAKQTDLNRPSEEQMTLLFFALQNAIDALDGIQLDAVSWLLDHGADPKLLKRTAAGRLPEWWRKCRKRLRKIRAPIKSLRK